MAGFHDLVLDASETVGGRLVDCPKDTTEGTTWEWTLTTIQDHSNADIDLTSATIVCKVITDITDATPTPGTELLTLTATGGVGTITFSATSTATAGLAGAPKTGRALPRQCYWYCTVTSGGNKVQFWGPASSPFRIFPQG